MRVVIIQTYMPENSTIKFAAKQDYLGFYSSEIETRKLFNYPPFSKIIKIAFFGKEELKTEKTAKLLRETLVKKLSNKTLIHPVIPSRIKRVKDIYGFFFLVRGKSKTIRENYNFPNSRPPLLL